MNLSKIQASSQQLTKCLLEHLSDDETFFNKLNNAFVQYYRKENALLSKYPFMYEASKTGDRQSREYDQDKKTLKYRFANSPIIINTGRKIATLCGDQSKAYIKEMLKG